VYVYGMIKLRETNRVIKMTFSLLALVAVIAYFTIGMVALISEIGRAESAIQAKKDKIKQKTGFDIDR
jgi:predicted histidine transporter YuiF (NhaC family)